MQLIEGLRENDLKGLVLPVVSIDQYESKIDDDAIVIAFFVQFKDAAIDLNRFIQKSAVDILDTEVSPAPTENGYYLVFVEIVRDDKFPNALSEILHTLSNLVDFDDWRFTAYNVDGVHDLDDESIANLVRLTSESDVDESFAYLDRLILEGRIARYKRSRMPSMSETLNLIKIL